MNLTYLFIFLAIVILILDFVIIIAVYVISSKAYKLEERKILEIEKLEETLKYENKKD